MYYAIILINYISYITIACKFSEIKMMWITVSSHANPIHFVISNFKVEI